MPRVSVEDMTAVWVRPRNPYEKLIPNLAAGSQVVIEFNGLEPNFTVFSPVEQPEISLAQQLYVLKVAHGALQAATHGGQTQQQ